MAFDLSDEEDVLDLEEEFRDVQLPDQNMYIADSQHAAELLALLIHNESPKETRAVKKIRLHIDQLFGLFSNIRLDNELQLHQEFMQLCSKLSKRQKIRKIRDKVVISFGGKFSAGKSQFINSISGIDGLLPVKQQPTTSIPTYIIGAEKDGLQANSIYGYSVTLTKDTMGALTHEFDEQYHIGFAPFIDSIIAESSKFSLPSDICLLDTPGYSADQADEDARTAFSDRQKALEQLSITDYLIWLVDIDNGGGLQDDDITFIKQLSVKTSILVVFNKSDLKTPMDVSKILEEAKQTLHKNAIHFFGVTAFSSRPDPNHSDRIIGEYDGKHMIEQFIDNAIASSVRSNDVLSEFQRLAKELRCSIQAEIERVKDIEKMLFKYIEDSDKIMQIRSLTEIWGHTNQEQYQMTNLKHRFEDAVDAIQREIKRYIESE